MFTIEREGAYRLEASVEESHLAAIRVGPAGVGHAWTASIAHIDARVSEIVPAVDAASRAYTVKIDLPALPALALGSLRARRRSSWEAGRCWRFRSAAVSERGQLQSVFVA